MWGGVSTREHRPAAVYSNADGSELMVHGTVRPPTLLKFGETQS